MPPQVRAWRAVPLDVCMNHETLQKSRANVKFALLRLRGFRPAPARAGLNRVPGGNFFLPATSETCSKH